MEDVNLGGPDFEGDRDARGFCFGGGADAVVADDFVFADMDE